MRKTFLVRLDIRQRNMDRVGAYSRTRRKAADSITQILAESVRVYLGTTPSHVVDCLAGVGGNTVSFADTFRWVTAIEYNDRRFRILAQHTARLPNVIRHRVDLRRMIRICGRKSRVFFLDPPWGGQSYKATAALHLSVGTTPLTDIVRQLWAGGAHSPKLVAVKVPANFALDHFRASTRDFAEELHLCQLPKMQLLVLRV